MPPGPGADTAPGAGPGAAAGAGAAAPHRAVVALGANLGDREATLRAAVADLDAADGIRVVAVSPLVESVAVALDGPDAGRPGYLNGVALVESGRGPRELLELLHRIEADHGRVRLERWGDRTLDLDLVDVDGAVLDTGGLTLPHPRAAERDFVLGPWLAVDPEATLPGRGRVDALLAALVGAGR
ncbi:MAG: 2-amino-4-hydroxy-6-hydroxymethyldihydropteridine diphosphokinase [Micrococcales bacterium]|nr:2-amino-4-hydroxy-6-hydroxymethyldihydropteridine diphosphokinase [Micrococcales bacterium]